MNDQFAYVSLLYGDTPAFLQALVLGATLRDLGSRYDSVLLCREDVPEEQLRVLARYFTKLVRIDPVAVSKGVIDPRSPARFSGVFDKLHALRLTGYRKVLFLDTDTLPLKSLDHLFELPAPAALIRDDRISMSDGVLACGETALNRAKAGEPYLNAGVMLLSPGEGTFETMARELSSAAASRYRFFLPEEVYLSRFFAGEWRSLSWRYNFRPNILRSAKKRALLPKQFAEEIAIVHYCGGMKPFDFAWRVGGFGSLVLSSGEEFLLRTLRGERSAGNKVPWYDEAFARLHLLWIDALCRVSGRLADEGIIVENLFDKSVTWVADARRPVSAAPPSPSTTRLRLVPNKAGTSVNASKVERDAVANSGVTVRRRAIPGRTRG